MSTQTDEGVMPTSKTREIVDALIAQIEGGILLPGQQLPSSAKLSEQFGCSLMPVKLATAELKIRGYVYGVARVGVFVAERPSR